MTLNPTKPPKAKVCKTCKAKFVPQRPMAVCCSPFCALTHARSARAKAEKVRLVKEKRETKAKLLEKKGRGYWIAQAQKAFNLFIRSRDHAKPCICCGLPLGTGEVGGAFDCGHYRSVGSAPHLRFDERNAHAQRKFCNRWGAGRAVDYRIGLVKRIGLAAVEALECDQESRKWSIDDLKAIKADYTARVREMKARTA